MTVQSDSRDINEVNKIRPDGTIPYILPKPAIPKNFTNAAKSSLRCTVEAGSKTFDIDLKD